PRRRPSGRAVVPRGDPAGQEVRGPAHCQPRSLSDLGRCFHGGHYAAPVFYTAAQISTGSSDNFLDFPLSSLALKRSPGIADASYYRPDTPDPILCAPWPTPAVETGENP